MWLRQEVQAVPRQVDLNERVRVVAAILRAADGRILLAERRNDPAFAGQWEFPGGKIADGELPEAALQRELEEELGIQLHRFEHFEHLEHRYPDRFVALDFYLVHEWAGEPRGREGQGLCWRHPSDIQEHELLAADAPVLARLRNRL